ncbi:MAG: 3-hydroxyacyl-CoA dehydrogenase family protein [Solirubrobacterales bacterium]
MTSSEHGYERPAIAGSGAIACGVAASVSVIGEVVLLARSEDSASSAIEGAASACAKLEGAEKSRIRATTDEAELSECDLIVEAIVEDVEAKAELIARLAEVAVGADLATTTSSLTIGEIGRRCGHPERVYGLHVFNPVPRMDLIELCLPAELSEGIADRARAWCERIGKRAIEVPDQAGFVVNRLLFPYLFDAVRLAERTGLEPAAVDDCMTLGAGHPMGPLKLLDFIGLDVAAAIGEALEADSGEPAHAPPEALARRVAAGRLGRKSGSGFYEYD